jgi:cell division protein FtsB|tara:strand:+ start:379 stop:726 length:348 start_codon:yes stop_codon:yes gene_type:complete
MELYGNKMCDRIKYTLMMIGVFSLVAIFYITKKKIEIKSLQKLIDKTYKQKQKIIQANIDKLVIKTTNSKGNTKDLTKKLDKLSREKEVLEQAITSLSDQELVSSIDDWFKNKKQ